MEGASVTLHDVTAMTDETWETLDDADAIIFGSPTYMGTTSKEFSAFSQQSSGPWFEEKWVGKVAGGFTISLSPSGDKSNVFNVLMTLANQHGMLWVSLGHGPGLGDPNAINRMGYYSGAAAQFDNNHSGDDATKGDIETAIAYGQRVAETARALKRGRA